jgi:hypothetical protein
VTDDELKQREAQIRGEKAKAILESSVWQESWAVYETRLMDEFKACKSDDVSRLQQLKMLHLAGVAARSHLEAILVDGRFASQDIEFKAQQSRFRRVLEAIS